MKTRLLLYCVVFIYAIGFLAPIFGEELWMREFEAAKKKATDEKKHLLVLFLSPQNIREMDVIKKELVGAKEFQENEGKQLILLEVPLASEPSSQAFFKDLPYLARELKFRSSGLFLFTSDGRPWKHIRPIANLTLFRMDVQIGLQDPDPEGFRRTTELMLNLIDSFSSTKGQVIAGSLLVFFFLVSQGFLVWGFCEKNRAIIGKMFVFAGGNLLITLAFFGAFFFPAALMSIFLYPVFWIGFCFSQKFGILRSLSFCFSSFLTFGFAVLAGAVIISLIKL
jgi:hypothetical protein